MKTKTMLLVALGALALCTFTGMYHAPRSLYSPLFMEREELERSVSYSPGARDLVDPGKIFYRDPYIYVNERYKGIHVINNTRPDAPVNEGFIVAPGCIDMAVKGDILYLDNAVDLVAFDLSARVVTKRVKNIFPEPPAPDGAYSPVPRPDGLVRVGWKKINPETTRK